MGKIRYFISIRVLLILSIGTIAYGQEQSQGECSIPGTEPRANGTCYCPGKNMKLTVAGCESTDVCNDQGDDSFRDDLTGRCLSPNEASNDGRRGDYGSSPLEILDNVTQRANVGDDIQSTALDNTSQTQGSYPFQYRVANTFDSIRKRSAPYLDWLFYIGLSLAGTLIIWQGLQLVVGAKTLADIRKPLTNIVVGVIILTGVYLIIKLVTSVLALILNI